MDMFSEARAMYATMRLCAMTQKELGMRLGVTQSYVANKLRLLELTEEEQRQILEAALSERHARALVKLKDQGQREQILKKVIDRHLTVRECEALVDIAYTPTDRYLPEMRPHLLLDKLEERICEEVKTMICYGLDVNLHRFYEGGTTYLTVSFKR